MSTTAKDTNTIRLHRVLRATPERVYRAFLDPDALDSPVVASVLDIMMLQN